MRRSVFPIMVLLLAIGMMVYAGNRLLETETIYREGNATYEALSDRVRTGAATNRQPPKDGIIVPNLQIDFDALRAVNEDAVAWLYSPDTVIDYPIMKSDDYNYYLTHLPDGTRNANGTLFIDYNNAPDFSDPLTVIYGHHMKSGRMFGSIVGYKNQEYFEKHPFMYLYTEQGHYRIDLIYGCVIGAGQWRERAFMYPENVQSLMAYAAHNTTFMSDAKYVEGDRIIALATCSYEFDNARYVVIGILRESA